MGNTIEVADWIIFIGRFHPLMVHLPIGFILAGIVMYFLAGKKRFALLKGTVPFLLGGGGLGAILSCVLGYMLSFQGGYDAEALSTHQWMGVGLAVFAILAFVSLVWKKTVGATVLQSSLMILLLLGLGYTGHMGGNLTHGSTYLIQYSPDPIRKLVGLPPKPEKRPQVSILDSADIFLDVVSPMLADNCISCHHSGKSKGGLLLTSYEEIVKGGNNGPGISVGDLENSEIFRRVSLPEYHDDFMPPDGKRPFSEEQKKLLELWILNGAPENALMGGFPVQGEYLLAANKILGIESARSSTLNLEVEAADSLVIVGLVDKGYVIKKISGTSNLLDVTLLFGQSSDIEGIEELLSLKSQIVYLNLAGVGLKDDDLKIIGEFKNLIRLNIHSNPISDIGLSHLVNLDKLESLNLYGTQIGNDGLGNIAALKNLKRVYIWNTGVTGERAAELKTKLPNLKINIGELNL